MSSLSAEQLAFFRENGYLVLENVFDPAEVRAMQAEADFVLETTINSSLYHKRRSGRLDWRTNSAGVQMVRKIQPINDMSLLFSQVSADPRLRQPLADVMGDEPMLMEEKLNYKQPLPTPVQGLDIRQLDDTFPVHNDWAYYKHQNYPQSVLSSALLLDDCRADSGPLRVWPGSHRQHLEHAPMENGLEVRPELIDHDGGIDMLAPAGSFMIFHVLLVHNSKANTSGRPRRLMIYSHFPKSEYDQPADVRNGPGRLHEGPYEREYFKACLAGRYTPTFTAPVYA